MSEFLSVLSVRRTADGYSIKQPGIPTRFTIARDPDTQLPAARTMTRASEDTHLVAALGAVARCGRDELVLTTPHILFSLVDVSKEIKP